MKRITWSLLLIVTVCLLIISVFTKDWLLTLLSMASCVVLSKYNKQIDIPEFYKSYGITKKLFENTRK